MQNKEKMNPVLVFIADDETFKLEIVKREKIAYKDYLKGEEAVKFVKSVNALNHFHRYYRAVLEIKRGDVYVAKFAGECGNELDGMHFVVALVDSPAISPIVTVAPLKSIKPGKALNPASDVYVGKIPGMDNGKEALVVINQIRSIDKVRLFDYEILNRISDYENGKLLSESNVIYCVHTKHYRLDREQIGKIHKAALEYMFNGFIKH